MNKLYALALVLLLVGGGAYYYFEVRCTEPDEMTVALAGLQCTLDLLNRGEDQLREQFCAYLGRESLCELSEEDRPKVMEMINADVLACTKATLAKDNFCTENVRL